MIFFPPVACVCRDPLSGLEFRSMCKLTGNVMTLHDPVAAQELSQDSMLIPCDGSDQGQGG